MQIVIDIDERVYCLLKYFEKALGFNDKKDDNDDVKTALIRAVINGTPFPKGATNGNVIKAMFPNINIYEHGSTYSVNNEYNFNSTWWNAQYKAESECKEWSSKS